MLASAIQKHESAISTHMSPPLETPSHSIPHHTPLGVTQQQAALLVL